MEKMGAGGDFFMFRFERYPITDILTIERMSMVVELLGGLRV